MATLTDFKKFLANEPQSVIEFRTIEIFHPQLSQVYRFVSAYTDQQFGLESTAPRSAGQTVTFDGVTLEIIEPAEREDSEQVLSVIFGNVDGRVHDIVDQISGQGFFDQVELIYRKYYSGDLTEPAVPPITLFVSSLSFDGPTTVKFNAEDTDLSAKRSGTVYTFEQFPGLRE